MIYNNLIYLLVVIIVLSTGSVPENPQFSWLTTLIIFTGKGMLLYWFVSLPFRRFYIGSASRYFSVEQRNAILAIASFAVDVYALDCKYYFAQLPLAGSLPFVIDAVGLILFLAYLSLNWRVAVSTYNRVFGAAHRPRSFIKSNLKINLALVLPWLLLSIVSDLLAIAPFPFVRRIMSSQWGEPVVLLLFFLVLAFVFPVIITRLWDCRPMSAGPLRSHIEQFCRRQNLQYKEILIWPLYEGQMLTAGVMGLIRNFRYIMITPALLKALSPDELDAVIAHEAGHVKRFHLPLYIVLFVGFGITAQIFLQPFMYLLLSSDFFYDMVRLGNNDPTAVLTFMGSVPLIIFMIIYFRFIFGFFMRNFERQADLYAFTVMEDARPLISALEKVGVLSGNIRDMPSWHHFGIGQRVEFLEKCQMDVEQVKRHHVKVYGFLAAFLAVVGSVLYIGLTMPQDMYNRLPREKFAELIIEQKIEEEADNPLWYQLMGDLQLSRELYDQAIQAYETSLKLDPENHGVLNNYAWLLLTAGEEKYRNPEKALRLARKAVEIQKEAFVLDTLAEAQWAKGMVEKAVATEKRPWP